MSRLFNIYNSKKVLVTGHTGFKGSWLSLWLNKLKADVYGISVSVPTNPSHFESSNLGEIVKDIRLDITDKNLLQKKIEEINPDFIFHLAAQPLVSIAYQEPIKTMTTNAIGTINLLDSIKNIKKPLNLILITSDKVYENLEWPWGYREIDQLGGKDPYSASKSMTEIAIRSFFYSYFNSPESQLRLGIARAGNVIGGGDWAKDRIITDCIKAWSCDDSVEIRNPYSTRPWQHVLEPLSGYLTLGFYLNSNKNINGNAYNFGPNESQNYSVENLIEEMKKYWKKSNWNNISNSNEKFSEANLLKLNCDKAYKHLNWYPTLDFHETIEFTAKWYLEYYHKSKNTYNFSLNQINKYEDLAKKKNIKWAK